MRIITGRFKRRKLLSNPGLTTRPISDRVKQSLFQFIEELLPDARVADVFAGTGTLGLEALSRGAERVVFIEQDRHACELLRKNVKSLKADDEAFCWQTDAAMTSFKPKQCEGFFPYDIIFFDPPYRLVKGIQPGRPLFKSLGRLAREDVSAESASLFFRTPSRATFQMPDEWELVRTFEYSTMEVHWFRKRTTAVAQVEPEAESEADSGELDTVGDPESQVTDETNEDTPEQNGDEA